MKKTLTAAALIATSLTSFNSAADILAGEEKTGTFIIGSDCAINITYTQHKEFKNLDEFNNGRLVTPIQLSHSCPTSNYVFIGETATYREGTSTVAKGDGVASLPLTFQDDNKVFAGQQSTTLGGTVLVSKQKQNPNTPVTVNLTVDTGKDPVPGIKYTYGFIAGTWQD
ncbi:TPA: hypothetical protein ACXKGF_005209 [Escherichia coli]